MKNIEKSVAIIGLSGIFPEADSLNTFFQNLKEGVDSVRNISIERLQDTAYNSYSQYMPMAFLDNVSHFDHLFFGISGKEAEMMAPEHRLALQLSYEAIENAGYNLKNLRGSNTAVYLGGGDTGYYKSLISEYDPTIMTGNMNAMIAGRISYSLNLTGPAMMIDTACSSSLVAVYEAYQKVSSGEVDMALAGGVHIMSRFIEVRESQEDVGILANDGRSKTFSANANGTGGGEGGSMLFLKRLDRALEDNDHIHAVIKGGAINNDGSQSAGLTAPSPEAQTKVVIKAWENSGVDPESIGYVEAHGTGTKLGDPIEFQALSDAFSQFSNKKKFCAISAVKTNIGHLNNAAGVAGIVKCIGALQQESLFPSLHFERRSPFIDFENSAVYVNDKLQKWESKEIPRRCGVSSFGLSGTNAHLILEEAPEREKILTNSSRENKLLKISAKSANSLKVYISEIHSFLSSTDRDLDDVLYTLNSGRPDYQYRCSISARNKQEFIKKLKQLHDESIIEKLTPVKQGITAPYIVFLLSNNKVKQQVIDNLSSKYPVFKMGFEDVLNKTTISPSSALKTFAFHYALYKQWQEMGMIAQKVIGAGVGRISKQVIVDCLELNKAVEAIEQDPNNFDNNINEEKLENAVKNLCKSGDPVFLELGENGLLFERIKTYRVIKDSNILVTTLLDEIHKGVLLEKISNLYNIGVSIDWQTFYGENTFRKVSAPTYPFEKIRCWPNIKRSQDQISVSKLEVSNWFYEMKWEKDTSGENETIEIKNGTFLVFMDHEDLGQMLVDVLESSGNKCVRIYLKDGYDRLDSFHYNINPRSEADYIRVEQQLSQDFLNIQGAIHLGNYSHQKFKEDHLEKELYSGVYSQFLLAKTFHKYLDRNFHLLFLTANGAKIEGLENYLSPVSRLSEALLKGIMAEYPLLKTHLVDVDHSLEQEAICQTVLNELRRDKQIRFAAYRNATRYIPKLFQVESLQAASIDVIAEGDYLITGGASGIGLEIAKLLASRTHIRLFIMGRTTLPAKEEWNGNGLSENQKQKIANLKVLENTGAIVEYHSVDLSDEAAMQHVFNSICEKTEKLQAVIHSAGLPGNWEPVYRKKLIDFKATLAPKVQGTLFLDKFSKKLSPDVFISFSSLNSIVAQKHSADYAVANAFEDAYMASKNGNTKYMAINWPGWYETGMSLNDNGEILDINNGPLPPISNKEGLTAFQLASGLNKSNVLVANVDLNLLRGNPHFILDELSSKQKSDDVSLLVIPEDFTETERHIAKIWGEVLKITSIKREDDFFDLGGHSLNGTQVMNRIEKDLGVILDFEDLFDYATIKDLSERVNTLIASDGIRQYGSIEPLNHQEYYQISHAQRRLWFIHQLQKEKTLYNLPFAFELKNLNLEALTKAFDKLESRHESLRTTFANVDGIPMQKIHPPGELGFKIEKVDVSEDPHVEQRVKELLSRNVQEEFDLEKGPLIRAMLIKKDANTHTFSFTIHHIICDGWSLKILITEITALYTAYNNGEKEPFSPLRVQYKDYVGWQESLAMEKDEDYWLKELSDPIEFVDLPVDYVPEGESSTFNGQVVSASIDAETTKALRNLAKQQNTSLSNIVLAVFNIFLHNVTGQKDLLIGLAIANRNHLDTEHMIGFFINTLIIKTSITEDLTFEEVIRNVSQTVLKAYEHQNYPFDLLVEKLNPDRVTNRQPLFNVMYTFQNYADININASEDQNSLNMSLSSLDSKSLDLEENNAYFDLTHLVLDQGDYIQIDFNYNSDLFDHATIEGLMGNYMLFFEDTVEMLMSQETEVTS